MSLPGVLARLSGILLFALVATFASAQERPPYGPPVDLATAKKMAAAAVAEANKNHWNVAITRPARRGEPPAVCGVTITRGCVQSG